MPPIRPTPTAADPKLWRPDWTKVEGRDPARLWLDKNENADPAMAEVVAEVVRSIPASMYTAYPDLAPLYHKLGRHVGLPADHLLLSHGSDGCIRAAFETFVSPGDPVVHSAPTFAMYGVYSSIYGAAQTTAEYTPSQAGPLLDIDAMIATVRKVRPKLTCLPNPDSPTGTVAAPDDLRRLIEAARDAGSVMLIDEAYYPFCTDTVLPWVAEYPNLIVTRSTGKAWGLAGFRIGYAAAQPELIGILHKIRPMYEVGAFAAAVFMGMLDHADDMRASVARLEAGKAEFLKAMSGLGFRTLSGHGNFCHVAFGDKAAAVHAALKDRVYYRADFKDPCLAGFSRFSTTTRERFQPVIDLIRDAVSARP